MERDPRRTGWMLAMLVLFAAGCGTATAVASRGSSVAYATTPTSPGEINPAAVPLGDGYVSTTPKVGYVDSCVTSFGQIGGSQVDGPWIDTAKHTWDYLTKLHVNGMIKWPSGYYHVSVDGRERVLKFNDLPTDHDTGIFPIESSDPAYAYDKNGNHIAAQTFDWKLALNPAKASKPSCLPGGAIGVLNDGVVLYDALDGEGRDAGAHEVLDICAGHPDPSDTYHHHDIPPCILDKVRDGTTKLVGYALDGYGIYVVKNKQGQMPSNTQLDACHGTVSKVMWNGKLTNIFHYVATLEYPYTVGCYYGTPISSGHTGNPSGGAGGIQGGPPGGGPPGGGSA
jgi:YHYH protein